eukprot:6659591-Prymnesium_polylepis.1
MKGDHRVVAVGENAAYHAVLALSHREPHALPLDGQQVGRHHEALALLRCLHACAQQLTEADRVDRVLDLGHVLALHHILGMQQA